MDAYGPQGWWPADTPFEVMVGAILTQNTSWLNVPGAIDSLKGLTPMEPAALLDLPVQDLRKAIRPSGYYRQKSDRLRDLCRFIVDRFDGGLNIMDRHETDQLREMLLAIRGIGPETADSILLYALNRPAFVVDAYTKRIFDRLGLLNGAGDYHQVQELFTDNLPADPEMFNEFHALIVVHAKERCRKKEPLCEGCGLEDLCRQRENRSG